MKLQELIQTIGDYSENATILAKKIDGRFKAESEAVMNELTEQEMKKPIKNAIRQRAIGMEYFLEIFIVREIVDYYEHLGHDTKLQLIDFIVYYAENDAYPE